MGLKKRMFLHPRTPSEFKKKDVPAFKDKDACLNKRMCLILQTVKNMLARHSPKSFIIAISHMEYFGMPHLMDPKSLNITIYVYLSFHSYT